RQASETASDVPRQPGDTRRRPTSEFCTGSRQINVQHGLRSEPLAQQRGEVSKMALLATQPAQ
ncbi:MAG TPA: hypothetical protein VG963_17330, partial [Polyangiaceae bacterium]|nr:hypothetical protein [Polyangiaceae bacterium]